MVMKYSIAKIEDVPEAVRTLYVKQGEVYVLDVEGVVAKEKLDEFRNNNISLQQRLDKFGNLDPTKANELLETQRKLQEKELIEAGKVDEVVNLRVAAMNEAHTTEKTGLTNRLTKAESQLQLLLIDNVIKGEALKSGVLPAAVDDIVLRARTMYTIVDGVPTPKSADGKIVYGKDGTTPMPIGEWMTALKTTAGHLFAGHQGGGAGGGSGRGTADLSKMSAVDKINYGIANGGLAAPKLPGT